MHRMYTSTEDCFVTRNSVAQDYAICVDNKHWPAFVELIQRGSNLWPDAPKEMKELADLITNGKIMQEYR